jgi:hypothetical protein
MAFHVGLANLLPYRVQRLATGRSWYFGQMNRAATTATREPQWGRANKTRRGNQIYPNQQARRWYQQLFPPSCFRFNVTQVGTGRATSLPCPIWSQRTLILESWIGDFRDPASSTVLAFEKNTNLAPRSSLNPDMWLPYSCLRTASDVFLFRDFDSRKNNSGIQGQMWLVGGCLTNINRRPLDVMRALGLLLTSSERLVKMSVTKLRIAPTAC